MGSIAEITAAPTAPTALWEQFATTIHGQVKRAKWPHGLELSLARQHLTVNPSVIHYIACLDGFKLDHLPIKNEFLPPLSLAALTSSCQEAATKALPALPEG